MSHFDTLTGVDILILLQAPGLNPRRMIEEVKIQHVNSYTQTTEGEHLI